MTPITDVAGARKRLEEDAEDLAREGSMADSGDGWEITQSGRLGREAASTMATDLRTILAALDEAQEYGRVLESALATNQAQAMATDRARIAELEAALKEVRPILADRASGGRMVTPVIRATIVLLKVRGLIRETDNA